MKIFLFHHFHIRCGRLALFLFGFLCSILLLSTEAVAQQEEEAGYVAVMRGEVVAVGEDGKRRLLQPRSPVYCGDTVKTGKTGRIQMVFNDNTLVSLGQSSKMEIADYEWSAGSHKGRMKTRIDEGVFRIMGGAITKHSPGKFKTETPLATIGIRGSMYAGLVNEDFMQVIFEGGTGIYVQNQAGQVELTLPGEGTTVTDFMESPQPPRLFDPGEVGNILQQIGISSSQIHNRSRIRNSDNIEIGKGSKANMGEIIVEQGSSVSGEITNQSNIDNSRNTAIGQDNEASMGTIIIE